MCSEALERLAWRYHVGIVEMKMAARWANWTITEDSEEREIALVWTLGEPPTFWELEEEEEEEAGKEASQW
jgi:hypothetical protein